MKNGDSDSESIEEGQESEEDGADSDEEDSEGEEGSDDDDDDDDDEEEEDDDKDDEESSDKGQEAASVGKKRRQKDTNGTLHSLIISSAMTTIRVLVGILDSLISAQIVHISLGNWPISKDQEMVLGSPCIQYHTKA